MNKMKIEKHRKRKEHIILSAYKVLSEKGYSNTSMEGISREAGYSKGGIFHYYDSKDDLMLEVISSFIKVILEAIQEAGRERENPYEQLREKLQWVMKMALTQKGQIRVILDYFSQSIGNNAFRDVITKYNDDIVTHLASLIDELKENGIVRKDVDSVIMSGMLLSTIIYGYFWRLIVSDNLSEDSIDKTTEQLVDSLMMIFLENQKQEIYVQ